MTNDIVSIQNVRGYLDHEGTAWLNAEDVARGLGWTQIKNGVEYVRWETINSYLREFNFPKIVGKADFIPENMFYRLAMKASNDAAMAFQSKIADEIMPSLRKTGFYITPDAKDYYLRRIRELEEEVQNHECWHREQENQRLKLETQRLKQETQLREQEVRLRELAIKDRELDNQRLELEVKMEEQKRKTEEMRAWIASDKFEKRVQTVRLLEKAVNTAKNKEEQEALFQRMTELLTDEKFITG